MTKAAWAVLAAATLLLAMPAAQAHGGAPPRAHETRILHDMNDDCGGDGVTANCRGTHDLIALDVRETWDPTLGDVLVVRLTLDKGASGAALKDTLTVKVGSATKTFALETADDKAFTGAFDRVAGPFPLNDGTRFAVEGTLKRSTLGAAVGDTLSGWALQSASGTTEGDKMPGSYRTSLGTDGPAPASEASDPTAYGPASYKLKGPVQYARLVSEPRMVSVTAGGEALVVLTVTSLLGDQGAGRPGLDQAIHLEAADADGAEVRFHNPSAGAYAATHDAVLRKGAALEVHVAVQGEAPASGALRVTLTTDLGGRVVLEVPYTVTAPGSTAPASTTLTSTSMPASDPEETASDGSGNGAPGPGPLPLAVMLAAMALWSRRRSRA